MTPTPILPLIPRDSTPRATVWDRRHVRLPAEPRKVVPLRSARSIAVQPVGAA